MNKLFSLFICFYQSNCFQVNVRNLVLVFIISYRSKCFDGDNSFKSPPVKRLKLNPESFKAPRTQSLLSLWTTRINSEHEKHHVEFAGRLAGDGPAKLYPNMKYEA